MAAHRLALLALLAIAGVAVACGGGETVAPPPPVVATVTLAGLTGAALETGDSIQVTPEARTAAGAGIAGISFSFATADPGVATISSTGWAKGVANGSTTITVTAVGPSSNVKSPVSATATLPVHQLVRRVRLTAPAALATGDTIALTAVAYDRLDIPISGITFAWSTSDINIADVTASGVVVARSYGTITLRASPSGPAEFLAGVATPPTDVAVVPVRLVFAQIAAGAMHNCGVARGGVVHCWGQGAWGRLGTGVGYMPWKSISEPVAALTSARFRSVDADDQQDSRSGHSCAVALDASTQCWGSGSWGMLGDGRHGEGIPVYMNAIPTRTSGVPDIAQVALGSSHTCLLDTSGDVWCAGSNYYGELGVGPLTNECLSPEACVTRFNRVLGGQKFVSIAAGTHHNCGITAIGDAWCWGMDVTGIVPQLPRPTLVPGGYHFASIDAGGATTCGITDDGVAYCWGSNWLGQTGTGTSGVGGSLVRVPTRVVTIARYVKLAMGTQHTCALASDGRAECWGNNDHGQLGATTNQLCGDPLVSNPPLAPCSPTPVAVNTSLRFTALAAGFFHSCGLVANGEVYCWGFNESGQLGTGDTIDRATPAKVVSTR